MENRQANAVSKVKVSREMVDAGVSALEDGRGSYSDSHLVESIYIAMRSLECWPLSRERTDPSVRPVPKGSWRAVAALAADADAPLSA